MNDKQPDVDVIDEWTIGTIHNEHYTPGAEVPGEYIVVERTTWTDRTYYTLSVFRRGDGETCDLNRDGWQQLRALCDAVLAEMDATNQEVPHE